MANILDRITIGDIQQLTVDADPAAASGTVAPIGSVATDTGTGLRYVKTGALDTAWTEDKAGDVDLTADVTGVLSEANGGTGESTYTDGQVLIGNTGGGLTKNTLTGGDNITVTNGSGAITIAAPGLIAETLSSVTTFDATVTTIDTIAIPTNSLVLIQVKVCSIITGGVSGNINDSNAYIKTAHAVNRAGVVTLFTQSDFTYEDEPSFNSDLAVSGTNVLIRVTGNLNNTVDWEAGYSTRTISS